MDGNDAHVMERNDWTSTRLANGWQNDGPCNHKLRTVDSLYNIQNDESLSTRLHDPAIMFVELSDGPLRLQPQWPPEPTSVDGHEPTSRTKRVVAVSCSER